MPGDPAADAAVFARLTAAGLRPGQTLVAIHVSAGNPFRRWPAGAFVDLIEGLVAADPTRRIAVTSGPSDAAARRRVIDAARARLGPGRAEAVADSGEFDLDELRALLARASLFVGGDSGPLHLASTTPVAVVGLYGPTLPARSRPWRDPAFVSEAIEVDGLACRPCDQRRCATRRLPLPHRHRPGDGAGRRRAGPRAAAAEGGRMSTGPAIAGGAHLTGGVRARDRLDLVGLAGLMSLAAALQVSIAAAGICLGVMLLFWVLSLAIHHERVQVPGMYVPLVVYAVLTLASSAFARDPQSSFVDDKQLVILLIVPAVYHLARGRRAELVLNVVITVGALSALVGIVQYGVLNYDNLGRRPAGLLDALHDLLGRADAGDLRGGRRGSCGRAIGSGRR